MTDENKTRSRSGKPEDIHPAARPFLWIEKPVVHLWFLILLAAASFALGAIDFIHERHEYVDWAEWHGFYAWFGFGGFALAVLSGWPLRRLIGRPENYYEKAAGDE